MKYDLPKQKTISKLLAVDTLDVQRQNIKRNYLDGFINLDRMIELLKGLKS